MMQGLNPNGKLQMVKVDADGKLVVTGVSDGGGSSTSDTTEATQLSVKAAVQSIDAKAPALVAGKVPVTDPTALPLPAGAATAAAQASAIARTSRFDGLALRAADESVAGTTYTVKTPTTTGEGPAWLTTRIVVASGQTEFGYAGPANNPGHASAASAWASRTTLVYGLPSEA